MAKQYTTRLVIDGSSKGAIKAVHATRGELRQLDSANQRSARNTRTATQSMRRSFSGVHASITSVRTAAVGLGGALALRKTIRSFADFEKGLIGVGKTTGLAGDELAALGDDVQELAQRVPVATTKLLEIAQSAGQLGVKGRENIARFTETVAKLGTASDLAGEQAATSFARLLTVTGEPIENVDRLGAAVVQLGNNYAATESEITHVSQRVAQSTAQFEVGAANVLGISTALQAVGVQAEAGGTQVGKAFQEINKAVRNGGDEMQTLQRITGQTGEELREAFLSGEASQVFQSFVEGLGRIQQSGGDVGAVLDEMNLTGTRASQVLGTLATRSDVLGKALNDANAGWDENIALNKEAAVAATSFSSQMQLVANSANEAAAELGRVIAPTLLDGMGTARDLFRSAADNADLLVSAGGALASVFAGRLAGSMAAATKAAIANRTATVAAARADQQAAASGLRYAQVQAVTAERSLTNAKLQASLARGTAQQAAALKGLDTAQRTAVRSRLALTEATAAASVANTAYARTATVAGVAARGLSSAMALVGGPFGVAILAAGALYSFRDELGLIPDPAEEAEQAVRDLTGELDKNTSAAERNTVAWKNNRISQMQSELVQLKQDAESARQEYERLQQQSHKRVARGGGGLVPGLSATRAAGELGKIRGEIDARNKAIDELEETRDKLVAELRGEDTGGSGTGGRPGGDSGVAKLLNEYDSATVKLNKLTAAREKLVAAMDDADPDNLERYKRAIAEVDERIERLGENQKRTGRSGRNAASQLQRAYEQASSSLSQQIALFGETGQAAQTRYQVERGALSALSDQRKQGLIQMSEELDQLNAQKARAEELESLRRTLATPEERRNATIEKRLTLINDNVSDPAERAKLAARAWEQYREKATDNIDQVSTFATRAAENIQDELGDNLEQVLSGNFDGILESWAGMLQKMAAQAAAANLNQVLFGDTVGGGDSSGLLGIATSALGSYFGGGVSSASAGTSLADAGIGGIGSSSGLLGFAEGGRPPVGRPVIVGEEGKEVFWPDSAGTIIPNGGQISGGAGSPTAVFKIEYNEAQGKTTDERQADQQNLMRQLERQWKSWAIRDANERGSVSRTYQNTYGLKRKGAA